MVRDRNFIFRCRWPASSKESDMKLARFVLTILIGIAATVAHAIPVSQVPNPRATHHSWVEDQAQILGPDYTQLINQLASQLHDKVGVEMAVITVDNLDGESIEHYANELFTRYGVGEAGKDNGVMILVARDDRKARVEVGYGLEAILNDAKAGRILDETAIPWFHDDQFGRGLFETAKKIAVTLAEAVGSSLDIADPSTWPTQPEIKFQKAPLRKGILVQVLIITTFLFSIPAVILAMWYGVRFYSSKSRLGRRRALVHNDAFEASLLFMGPIAAGMIGHSEGNIWVGFAAVPIPIALWGLVRLFHRRLSAQVNLFQRNCPTCGKPMAYLESATPFLSDSQKADVKSHKMAYEAWNCQSCGKEDVVGVTLPQDEKNGRSKSRGSSGSGSSSSFGGGRSGGGGASRGF